MTKIEILWSHLSTMDEKRMEIFKLSLCQLKPRLGAEQIKMEDIENKSIKQMLEFVFRYHTERRAVATIRKALGNIKENQIKMLINKDLRIASKSNGMVKKQDVTQACKMASIMVAPTCNSASCSEPSAKKMKQDQDMDAELEASKNKKATSSDTEGQRPVLQAIKQETPEVIPKQPNVTNDEFGLPVSCASSKQPPQVNLTQGNITNHSHSRDPNKQMGVALTLTSSKEQPQVTLTQSNNMNNGLLIAPNQQCGLTPSHTSSKEPTHVNPTQGNIANNSLPRAPKQQFGVTHSHISSKEQTQVYLTKASITNNTHPWAPNELFGAAPSHTSSKEQPQGGLTQSNITNNVLLIAPNQQYGVTPFHTSSKERLQVSTTQSNITNILLIPPNQLFGVASFHTFFKEQPQNNPTQGNITTTLPMAPNEQIRVFSSQIFSKASQSKGMVEKQDATQVYKIRLVPTCDVVPCSEPSEKKIKREQDRDAELEVSEHKEATSSKNEGQSTVQKPIKQEPEEVVIPNQETITHNIFPGAPLSQASYKPVTAEPSIISLQGNATNNTIPRAPNQQLGLPSKVQKQFNHEWLSSALNTFLTAPNRQRQDAPSHTSSKDQPQVNPIQENITNTLPRVPNEQVGVTHLRGSSKGQPPQVIPKQSNSINIIHRATDEQFRGAPSKVPPPQVNPKQSNAKNTIHGASNEQFRGAPFKAEQQQVNPTEGKVIKNTLPRAPSEKYGAAPSHTPSKVYNSKSMRENQDQTRVCKMASTLSVPTCDALPCSEPSAKMMKQEQIRDAELEASKQNIATASTKEGRRPDQRPIKQGPPEEVKPKKKNLTNYVCPKPLDKTFKIPLLQASSKKQPQGHIKKMLPRAPNKRFREARFHTSSKEPPPQHYRKQNSITRYTYSRTAIERYRVGASHTSSKEQPQGHPTQDNVTKRLPWAPNKPRFYTSSKRQRKQ